jgi:hypothetical protein
VELLELECLLETLLAANHQLAAGVAASFQA